MDLYNFVLRRLENYFLLLREISIQISHEFWQDGKFLTSWYFEYYKFYLNIFEKKFV